MRYFVLLIVTAVNLTMTADFCQQVQATDGKPAAPLPIGVVGLAHGHAMGFFRESLSRPDIKIVGIAEPDQQLASRYAKRHGLDPSLLFTDLESPPSGLPPGMA